MSSLHQKKAEKNPPDFRAELPTIETNNRQLRDKRKDTIKAIAEANQPARLFHGDSGLTIVGEDKDEGPELRTASRDAIQDFMADAANWVSTAFVPIKSGGFKEVVKQVLPPAQLAENYLAQSKWPGIPAIDGIVTAPVFARDGTLCTSPGYNPSSRLWLSLPPEFDIGDTAPTPDAVRDSLDLIKDLLQDIAFADDASRAHAYALLLLPFVRLLINGPTPLHLIDAPTQSSGKSFAAKICIAPFGTPSASSMKGEDEEWRKAIMAALLSGRSHLFLDNVKGALTSPMLAAALTEPMLTERAMGSLNELTVKVRCVWVATSNNARLDADTASRCVVIRLDTGMENPERREFKFNPLDYIQKHRSQVVGAICTLIRNWQEQGSKPYSGKGQTRFGQWQDVVGGILEANKIPGFLDNLDQYREALDPEKAAWGALCETWYQEKGAAYVNAVDILPLAVEIPEIAGALGDREGRSQSLRFGKQLQVRRDKVFGPYKITAGIPNRQGATYRLEVTQK